MQYFDQKNGFIEFVFENHEREFNPYGFHLNEEEKK